MQSIAFAKSFLRRMMDHPKSGLPDFGPFKCASRINPTCVAKRGGDATPDFASSSGLLAPRCGAAHTRWVKRRQASGCEWAEVNAPRRAVEDQFAHRLAGRGRV